MPKIRFVETCVVQNCHKGTDKEERFEKGRVYDLNAASANHWTIRGKAVLVGGGDSVTVGAIKDPAKPVPAIVAEEEPRKPAEDVPAGAEKPVVPPRAEGNKLSLGKNATGQGR